MAEPERRRRAPLLILLVLLLLVGGGAAGAYFLLGGDPGVAIDASPSVTPSAEQTPSGSSSVEPSSPSASIGPSPTPEPTPDAGDTFAFYEVAVSPDSYTLYAFDNGSVGGDRVVGFDGFSFARVEPEQGSDGAAYWVTQNGDLTGVAYRYPDSGDFRIRAVFLNDAGDRRSAYLGEGELDQLPEATPAP